MCARYGSPDALCARWFSFSVLFLGPMVVTTIVSCEISHETGTALWFHITSLLWRMAATFGSEAPTVGAAAPPPEDVLGSKRSEADRKQRQREYQAAHLKKKKEETEEAARELTVLREERVLIARSLVSALDSDDRPLNLGSFNLPTIAQLVAGKLILSRSAGPCVAGACAPCPVKPKPPSTVRLALCQAQAAQHHFLPCRPN